MTKPHPHAALMAEYAKDAAETHTPWERWQFKSLGDSPWLDCNSSPAWTESYEYRRKPQPVQRFIPVIRMSGGSLALSEGKFSRNVAADDDYNGRRGHEALVGILHVQISPETLELVSASMEKL